MTMNNNAKFEEKLTFHFKTLHLFLGHDGYFKNYYKNFSEPYHEELSGKA